MHAAQQFLLESRCAVQGEVVFDHAVGNLAGHLVVGHLMLGEVLGGETRAIDAGGEFILVRIGSEVQVLKLRKLAVGDGAVCLDLGEVHHGGGGL